MENVWLILIHNSELLALPAEHVFAAMVPGCPHVFHSVKHVWGQENMDFSDATHTFPHASIKVIQQQLAFTHEDDITCFPLVDVSLLLQCWW